MATSSTSRQQSGEVIVTIDLGGATIKVSTSQSGSGTIHSDGLKEVCPHCKGADCYGCNGSPETEGAIQERRSFNAAIDGLESFLLAQACQGIDIGSAAYCESIVTALDAFGNKYSDH